MPDEKLNTLRYRILRYTPNLIRDEWVNIGVFLEEIPGDSQQSAAARRAMRLVEEASEFARVRRLHPAADETLLRALPAEFDARLRGSETEVSAYLNKLEQSLSNVLQFSPQRAVLAENFDAEMDRLYHEHVALPSRARGGVVESTKNWIRSRLNDIFRRRRILEKLQRSVRVDEFTQPGDPFRIDYSYRYNGTRGYLHAIPLARDYSQAKVLAYTAERIRARAQHVEFSAITEVAPSPENPRHQFIMRLFEDQHIKILPLSGVEAWAESLRPRLR
ncbi:MAG TPA: DUF3037 domain-containing protein [Candidatus Dormibacteraeota bacterium]|nr:DUF3037 domain-containing protein [Candidatus Dormibacteraeota bacterium]